MKTRKKPNSKPKPGGTNVDAFNVGKFRDDDFFLDVTPRGVNHTELGLSTMEDNQGRPMQDHLSLEGALADATMDIVEEDGKGINQQRRVRIWDKKKRNYVQVNASEVGASGKRIKTESGAVVKKDAKAAGEVYKKWQLRTHRSISATGSQEDPLSNGGRGKGGARFKYRHTKGGEDDASRGKGGGGGGGGEKGGGWGADDMGELKTRDEVAKARKEAKSKAGRGGGGGGGRGGGRGGDDGGGGGEAEADEAAAAAPAR